MNENIKEGMEEYSDQLGLTSKEKETFVKLSCSYLKQAENILNGYSPPQSKEASHKEPSKVTKLIMKSANDEVTDRISGGMDQVEWEQALSKALPLVAMLTLGGLAGRNLPTVLGAERAAGSSRHIPTIAGLGAGAYAANRLGYTDDLIEGLRSLA